MFTLNGVFIVLYVAFSLMLAYKCAASKTMFRLLEIPLVSANSTPASMYGATAPSAREVVLEFCAPFGFIIFAKSLEYGVT